MSGSMTMNAPRGRPLIMLLAVLASWTGARAVSWESPVVNMSQISPNDTRFTAAPVPQSFAGQQAIIAEGQPYYVLPYPPLVEGELYQPGSNVFVPKSPRSIERIVYRDYAYEDRAWQRPASIPQPLSHQMMWLAAMRYETNAAQSLAFAGRYPANVQAAQGAPYLPPQEEKAKKTGPDRWSLDSWTFWRQGSDSAQISQGRVPIYGASQAGGVLQYRIAPKSSFDPRAYLRAYSATVSGGENELAAGVSARPLKGIPVRAYAEGRVTDTIRGREIRPAGFVATEIAPFPLPAGFKGEAYAQAGYVGGQAATWFADGQAVALTEIMKMDLLDTKMSVGGGAWAGAQQGAHRVDLGPTVRFDMNVMNRPTRVSVDYRGQVAGDAAPGSGVAATVSTSF